MFTARYAVSFYITQIRLGLKGIMLKTQGLRFLNYYISHNGFQKTQDTLFGYLIASIRNAYQIFVGKYFGRRNTVRHVGYVERNTEALRATIFAVKKQ